MNKYSMSEAIAKAIQLRGVDIIINKRGLSAILGDLLPGDAHRVERMVLLQPLEVDEWRVFAETHNKSTDEHIRAINVVRPKLDDSRQAER